MSGIRTSITVGLVLMQKGLSPISLDADVFQIVLEGENYTVHTDRLPEIYIEKRVPQAYFEYGNDNGILFVSMDRVNRRRSPVTVFSGGHTDALTFRCCLRPGSAEEFGDGLEECFTRIGQAVDAFGQACEATLRENGQESAAEFMRDLADPSPDSPWLQKKQRS